MKIKKLVAFAAILAITFSAFAFNFGGDINSALKTDLENQTTNVINLDNSLTLWMTEPIDFSGNTILSVAGFFAYNFDLQITPTQVASEMILDLSAFNLSMQIPLGLNNAVDFQFGRFAWSTVSNNLFFGNLDAVKFLIDSKHFNINLVAGYTGFLNGRTQNNFGVVPAVGDEKLLYSKNIASFIGAATILPKKELLEKIDVKKLNLEVIFNILQDKPEKNAIYLTGILEKSINPVAKYCVESTFLFWLKPGVYPANYTNATISLGSEKTSFNIGGIFASANSTNSEIKLSEFCPISAIAIDKRGSFFASSVFCPRVSLQFAPSKKFDMLILSDVFFDVNDDKLEYNEMQWATVININALSDMCIALKGGQTISKTKNIIYLEFSSKISY